MYLRECTSKVHVKVYGVKQLRDMNYIIMRDDAFVSNRVLQ